MTTLVKEAVERIWATLHQINGHWWNKRQRPDARDLVTLLASFERSTCEMCDDPAACPAERCAFRTAASLPTDDDDTVERVADAIVAAIKAFCTYPDGRCYAVGDRDVMEVDGEFDPEGIARAAIHTLIGRDR